MTIASRLLRRPIDNRPDEAWDRPVTLVGGRCMDADGWKGIGMIRDHERPGVAASL